MCFEKMAKMGHFCGFWAILSPIIFKFGLYIGLNRYDRCNKFERFILKNESKLVKKCPKSGCGATLANRKMAISRPFFIRF